MGSRYIGVKCKDSECSANAQVSGMCRRCYQRDRDRNHKNKRAPKDRLSKHRMYVRIMATQALSAGQRAERLVIELMSKLGMDPVALPRDIGSVVGLLNDMLKPIDRRHVVSPEYIRYWAGVFFGVDETYLEAIALILDDREPWLFFTFFSNKLTRALLLDSAEALARSQELQLAEKHLAAARVHLWHVCYTLCRRRYGPKTAESVFGNKKSAASEVDAFLN